MSAQAFPNFQRHLRLSPIVKMTAVLRRFTKDYLCLQGKRRRSTYIGIWSLFSLVLPAMASRAGNFLSTLKLQSIEPIRWLHIPNTGTSFGNVLIRWACNSSTPDIIDTDAVQTKKLPRWDLCARHFRLDNVREKWPIGDHVALPLPGSAKITDLRRVMTFLRGPGRRGKYLGLEFDDLCALRRARRDEGGQTQYILGFKNIPGPKGEGKSILPIGRPNLMDAQTACNRLSFFRFVGITDQWQASICLFHHKFGGISHIADLNNMRPFKSRFPSQPLDLQGRGCPGEF